MGFSIGSLLKTIAGPVIGTIVGGPLGGILGGAITSSFTRPNISIPGPTVTPVSASRVPGLIVGAGLMAVGTVAELLRLSRNNTGRPASARKIRDAARVCGLEQAASMFGLSTAQVCQIIISRPRRRGRGISAADMRRTRSTIRKISTLQHNLAHLVAHTRGKARGAGGRFI